MYYDYDTQKIYCSFVIFFFFSVIFLLFFLGHVSICSFVMQK